MILECGLNIILLGGLMQLFYSDPYGLVQVYGSSSGGKITIHTCIEDHQFQPQNFWYVFCLIWFAVLKVIPQKKKFPMNFF